MGKSPFSTKNYWGLSLHGIRPFFELVTLSTTVGTTHSMCNEPLAAETTKIKQLVFFMAILGGARR